jgi:hypothetical protein
VNKRRLASPAAPALKYLDVDLQANPVGVVGVLVRVQDLVHPGDHDLLNELGSFLTLLFGALDDQPVVAGDHGHRYRGRARWGRWRFGHS